MSAAPLLYHIESVATPGECWEIVQGRQPTEYEGDPAFVITPLFKSANQPDTGDVAALRAEAELEADMERDLTESDHEAIERSLRAILAFDAVGSLRLVLFDTMTRQASGYDWNADPDGMTLRQSTAIQQADRILAALSKPNAPGAHEDGGA